MPAGDLYKRWFQQGLLDDCPGNVTNQGKRAAQRFFTQQLRDLHTDKYDRAVGQARRAMSQEQVEELDLEWRDELARLRE